MIKFLKYSFMILIFAFFTVFSISNREFISLQLYPLQYKIEVPCHLLVIAIFIVSWIMYCIMSCFSKSVLRKEIKENNKLISNLKEENSLLKERLENIKQKQL